LQALSFRKFIRFSGQYLINLLQFVRGRKNIQEAQYKRSQVRATSCLPEEKKYRPGFPAGCFAASCSHPPHLRVDSDRPDAVSISSGRHPAGILLVQTSAGNCVHQPAAFTAGSRQSSTRGRYWFGLTGTSFSRTSKCRCTPRSFSSSLRPAWAMTCPCRTSSPTETVTFSRL